MVYIHLYTYMCIGTALYYVYTYTMYRLEVYGVYYGHLGRV